MTLGDQAGGRTNLTRRAVAALEGVAIDEGPLKGVQDVAFGETFDRRDLGAVFHDREGETRIDAFAVHENRARAALPVVASLFRSGQAELFAESVKEGRPRRNLDLLLRSIDNQRDWLGLRYRGGCFGWRARGRHRHSLDGCRRKCTECSNRHGPAKASSG